MAVYDALQVYTKAGLKPGKKPAPPKKMPPKRMPIAQQGMGTKAGRRK